MQLRHTQTRPDGAGWIPVGLCCLLLLLPMLLAPAAMQRVNEQESEESRQPAEEERSSEAALDSHSVGGRRLARATETRCAAANFRKRANSDCPRGKFFAIDAPAEQQLRNGLGAPLRC